MRKDRKNQAKYESVTPENSDVDTISNEDVSDEEDLYETNDKYSFEVDIIDVKSFRAMVDYLRVTTSTMTWYVDSSGIISIDEVKLSDTDVIWNCIHLNEDDLIKLNVKSKLVDGIMDPIPITISMQSLHKYIPSSGKSKMKMYKNENESSIHLSFGTSNSHIQQEDSKGSIINETPEDYPEKPLCKIESSVFFTSCSRISSDKTGNVILEICKNGIILTDNNNEDGTKISIGDTSEPYSSEEDEGDSRHTITLSKKFFKHIKKLKSLTGIFLVKFYYTPKSPLLIQIPIGTMGHIQIYLKQNIYDEDEDE